jgi:hypothetical protein
LSGFVLPSRAEETMSISSLKISQLQDHLK